MEFSIALTYAGLYNQTKDESYMPRILKLVNKSNGEMKLATLDNLKLSWVSGNKPTSKTFKTFSKLQDYVINNKFIIIQ